MGCVFWEGEVKGFWEGGVMIMVPWWSEESVSVVELAALVVVAVVEVRLEVGMLATLESVGSMVVVSWAVFLAVAASSLGCECLEGVAVFVEEMLGVRVSVGIIFVGVEGRVVVVVVA